MGAGTGSGCGSGSGGGAGGSDSVSGTVRRTGTTRSPAGPASATEPSWTPGADCSACTRMTSPSWDSFNHGSLGDAAAVNAIGGPDNRSSTEVAPTRSTDEGVTLSSAVDKASD